MMKVRTLVGKTYSVHTNGGCTVSDDTGWSQTIGAPGGEFVAHAGVVYLSDEQATCVDKYSVVLAGGGSSSSGGGAGLSASGEPVVALSGGSLTVKHATWFDNAGQAAVSVLPAAWKNEVMTCYLKSAVPVTLAGVTWLYGQPAMAAGYTYVIALQQVNAATVLANLAYTLPQ